MQNQKTLLLASFLKREDLPKALEDIKSKFVLASSRAFLLKNKTDEDKVILTYNIALTESKINFDRVIPGTISLHRKKETNTLYTLNALNEIVKAEFGSLNRDYVIKWEDYSNSIVVSQKDKGLIKIETELEKIIDLSKV